ncbi:MAG: lytic transglycosylase domain-containing protein [Rhodospirillales bacterium]|nr:lytic transglycosylase domain-containing protein [Rhodospirillales bacterium]
MARDNGLSPSLIAALVWRESSGNHRLVSAGSYYGLMQLTPREARRYGVGDKAVLKPRYNLEAGLSLLKDLLDENGNDEALALYAFNRGHAASSPRKARKNPYVKRVMETKRWFDSCEEMHLVRDCLKLALADK